MYELRADMASTCSNTRLVDINLSNNISQNYRGKERGLIKMASESTVGLCFILVTSIKVFLVRLLCSLMQFSLLCKVAKVSLGMLLWSWKVHFWYVNTNISHSKTKTREPKWWWTTQESLGVVPLIWETASMDVGASFLSFKAALTLIFILSMCQMTMCMWKMLLGGMNPQIVIIRLCSFPHLFLFLGSSSLLFWFWQQTAVFTIKVLINPLADKVGN